MLDSIIRSYCIPTQFCVLAHLTSRLEALRRGSPIDLLFQSISGTEAGNRAFGITLRLIEEARQAAMELRRGTVGNNVMYFETGAAKLASSDAVFVLADGLSAAAVKRHVAALLDLVAPRLGREGWRVAPVVIVRQARVAIGDEIARTLKAKMAVVLIGERPGLSAPDRHAH